MVFSPNTKVIKVFAVGWGFKQSRLSHIDEIFGPIHQVFNSRSQSLRLFNLPSWWISSLRLCWIFRFKNGIEVLTLNSFTWQLANFIAIFIWIVTLILCFDFLLNNLRLLEWNLFWNPIFLLTHSDSSVWFSNSCILVGQSNSSLSDSVCFFNFRQIVIFCRVEFFGVLIDWHTIIRWVLLFFLVDLRIKSRLSRSLSF
jgi:hypothetical protein